MIARLALAASAALLQGSRPAEPIVERAAAARGGVTKLRATGVLHVAGEVRFSPPESPAPLDFEAFVEQRGDRPRAWIGFRQGPLLRVLLLSGDTGFERDESGSYARVEGAHLAELRGEAASLLLAARFPVDGAWSARERSRLRRESDGVEVELSADARPSAATIPGADPPRRIFSGSIDAAGIAFPSRIAAAADSGIVWTLEIRKWEPHCAVLDTMFEPPKGSGDLGVILGPLAGAPVAFTKGRPFLRPYADRRRAVIPLAKPVDIPAKSALAAFVAEALKGRSDVGEVVVRGQLDEKRRLIALEIWESTAASRPASESFPLLVSVLLDDPSDLKAIAAAEDQIRATASARRLELEETTLLALPVRAVEPTGPFEVSRRVKSAR